MPQFKRLKAFGQYKNRTAVYNPASIVLHFAVAPVQLSGYPAITKYTPLGLCMHCIRLCSLALLPPLLLQYNPSFLNPHFLKIGYKNTTMPFLTGGASLSLFFRWFCISLSSQDSLSIWKI